MTVPSWKRNLAIPIIKLPANPDVDVWIDQEAYLPEDTVWGIKVYTQDNKVKAWNALKSWLDPIVQQMVLGVPEGLFGAKT